MVMIEKPPAAFADMVKGGRELLARLDPDEQSYVQRLFEARKSFKGGDRTGWGEFVKDNKAKAMAKRLREKVEGREVMGLIYKAVPITDGRVTIMENVFVVHSQLRPGEVNNTEGVLEEVEI